ERRAALSWATCNAAAGRTLSIECSRQILVPALYGLWQTGKVALWLHCRQGTWFLFRCRKRSQISKRCRQTGSLCVQHATQESPLAPPMSPRITRECSLAVTVESKEG